jgi:hypothetical protein
MAPQARTARVRGAPRRRPHPPAVVATKPAPRKDFAHLARRLLNRY